MTNAIPLRRVQTDLRALLVGALEVMREQANESEVALEVVVAPDVPRAHVDPEKIAWAVTTLVGNAMRFVRKGTRHMPGGSIAVRVERSDGIAISVEDDGPGIPTDKLPWLFERAPGTIHAAGLALMMVRDVVIAHGGSVDVASEHGSTRITMHLPMA
jgi:two-component system OmpR family sensor kinase